ncbi:DUF4247 domain-containing protein [Streptomyces sp. XM83C]|jgi:hypothetical protein|uniref:DUF4247 domain-containing protein n=1 Tax=Streptomyces thermocoprophilus TaxID=78356 RepID=A0ABV5VJQ4_9ACTN|nr:DUF4247 domain-containing protein [Streptomyces sp. XM83C]MCK1820338.1 DUF4247 domain-containing protein [Streptomyces sp. XM83C]
MNSARLVRGAVAAALAAVLLTACSSDGENGVPRDWISDHYTSGDTGWVDWTSAPAQVADEIDDHRSALDRASGDNSEFLRYGDDMVTVSPYGSGSLITIEDYRNGYHRHRQHLFNWPDPDSQSFRGGGPGEGK